MNPRDAAAAGLPGSASSERAFSRAALDAILANICVVDAAGRIILVNRGWRAFAEANGARPEEVCEGADYLAACSPGSQPSGGEAQANCAAIAEVIRGVRPSCTFEYECHSPTESRWFLAVASRFSTAEGSFTVIKHRDITPRKASELALRETEEQFRQIAENIPMVLWISSRPASDRILYVNPAFEQLWGHPAEALKRNPQLWLEAVHPEDQERLRRWQASGATEHDLEYRIVRPDGSVRWIHSRGFPVRNAAGGVQRVAGFAEDVTERKTAEARLAQLAHFDPLTGLPNRVLFSQRLGEALAQSRLTGRPAAVLFIDLDRFKTINDSLGHDCGDQLLIEAAARLRGLLRAEDTVGRLGGDEFAAVLVGLSSPRDAAVVAEKIVAALTAPFAVGGYEVVVTASVGLSLFPADAADASGLMKASDIAMYRAKELGRNGFQFYSPDIGKRPRDQLDLEIRLRQALERGEFVLHYQPRIDIRSRRMVGAEALLRWRAQGELVTPARFIPTLEETGLIVPVGEWVLTEVARQLAAWRAEGACPQPVAVNLSARQFMAPGLVPRTLAVLRAAGVPPGLLELEITESLLMRNEAQAERTLKELRELGLRLALDDFGTGYSSLSYLKRFPLDSLKIDKSFVHDLLTDPDDAAITSAIVHLAHALELKVVAEGVETEGQLAWLAAAGCDEAQGYLFHRPLEACELGALLPRG